MDGTDTAVCPFGFALIVHILDASDSPQRRYLVPALVSDDRSPFLSFQGEWELCRMKMHREDSFPGARRQAVISGPAVLIVSEGSSTCKKEKEPESGIDGGRLNVGMRRRRCNCEDRRPLWTRT
jgi:hypothetical protein